SINPAIRSRCHLFELYRLTTEQIKQVINHVLTDEEKGYGNVNINITDDAYNHFAMSTNGDVRAVLNGLELAVSSTRPNNEGTIERTLDVDGQCMQKNSLSHDKGEGAHDDVLSDFQKSSRGSDVDASLHYLATLIEAGDLESITR